MEAVWLFGGTGERVDGELELEEEWMARIGVYCAGCYLYFILF